MSDYTPTTEEVREAVNDRFVQTLGKASFTREQFNRWLAEHDRQKQAEAWNKAWLEIFCIPHWWNKEQQRGGFDLGFDGTEPATEDGAFMAVREVMLANPYREGEK